MKLNILTAALCALLPAGCGHLSSLPDAVRVSDREKIGLAGPVKSVRYLTFSVQDSAGAYRPGPLVPDRLKRSLGLAERNMSMEFDTDGFVIRTNSLDGMESWASSQIEYADDRRTVIEYRYDRDGLLQDYSRTTYGRDNRIRKMKMVKAGVPAFVCPTARFSYSPGEGGLIKTEGKVTFLGLFTVMETTVVSDDTRPVEVEMRSRGKMTYFTRSTYGDDGRLDKLSTRQPEIADGYAMDEHYRYPAPADEHGNWTERLIRTVHGEAGEPEAIDAGPEFITVRTMAYY